MALSLTSRSTGIDQFRFKSTTLSHQWRHIVLKEPVFESFRLNSLRILRFILVVVFNDIHTVVQLETKEVEVGLWKG
jgi:hypothetical protein